MPTLPNTQDNRDYFVIRYNEIGDLPNIASHGVSSDQYLSRMYNSNYNNIGNEMIKDLDAGPTWIAFTGVACNPAIECTLDDTYFHVFQKGSMPITGLNYSNLTRTFTNTDEAFTGNYIAIDTENEHVAFGGQNTNTNYTSLGGPQLPGGYYYLASYDIIP